MALVAGIDVGGVKRGFHAAVLDVDSGEFLSLINLFSPDDAVRFLRDFEGIQCVAIDSPPQAQIDGPNTRLAERQVNRAGFKVQWTRRKPMPPDEWMLNGERLWKSVREGMGQVQIIETFPTLVSGSLEDCELKLPLSLLKGGVRERFGYKDFVDASLCAWVAMKYLTGTAKSFGREGDEIDELGLIWY